MLVISRPSDFPDITALNPSEAGAIARKLDSIEPFDKVLVHPLAGNCLAELFGRYPSGCIRDYTVTEKGRVRYIFTKIGKAAAVMVNSTPMTDVYSVTKQLAQGSIGTGFQEGFLLLSEPISRTT